MASKWSSQVTKKSSALDLEEGVFKKKDPAEIAKSLKRSALASRRRKAGPYQSAVSMLNFYINRGGKNIPDSQKDVLNQAKMELKKLFSK